jgi:DNA-binding FadR family transcriptional regulator
MAREAAQRATEKDITDLKDIIERQRQSLGQAEEFISADMQFHTRIAQISGNPIFAAVSEAMLAWLKTYHTEMLIWTGKEKFTLVEHEEILEQLSAQNADGAEAAVMKHLERSRALYSK